jgi:tetratricopeptide (TPR) repeat protein
MTMRVFLPLLAASVLFAQTTAQDWINRGVEALRRAQYPQAEAAFQNAVDLDPSSASAHMYLATACMQQFIPGATSPENLADASKAEAEFRTVLDLSPDNSVAVLSLAGLAMNLQKWDEARRWFERAISIDPKIPDTYYSLAYIDWSRWYPAYAAARSSLGMRPDQPGPLPKAARIRLKDEWLPTIEDGIANLDKALGIKPGNGDAMAYMNLFLRERADLADTPEQYRADIAEANRWIQKAIEAKKQQTPAAPAQQQRSQ